MGSEREAWFRENLKEVTQGGDIMALAWGMRLTRPMQKPEFSGKK